MLYVELISSIVIYLLAYFFTRKYLGNSRIWLDPLGVFFLWLIVSNAYNEIGGFHFELQRVTYYNGSTLLFLCLMLAMFGAISVGAKYGKLLTSYRSPVAESGPSSISINVLGWGNLFIGFMFVTAIAHHLATVGTAIVIDRASHYDSLPRVIQSLLDYKYIFGFIIGLAATQINLKWILFSSIAVIMFGTLAGNKFSFFADFLFPMAAVYISVKGKFPFNPLRIFVVAVVAVIVIAGFVVYKYSMSSNDASFVYGLVKYRLFAGQSALWWAVVDRWQGVGITETTGMINVLAMDGKGIGSNELGMNFMMSQVLTPELWKAFQTRGYSLTMGFPAILIIRYGVEFSFLAIAVIGLAFGFVIAVLSESLRTQRYLSAVVGYWLLLPISIVIMTGNLYLAFSIGMVGKIGILFMIEFWESFRNFRRKRVLES